MKIWLWEKTANSWSSLLQSKSLNGKAVLAVPLFLLLLSLGFLFEVWVMALAFWPGSSSKEGL